MKNLELDYNNQTLVRNYIKNTVVTSIYEELVADYNIEENAEYIYDYMHEIIDGLSDVIYHYQAKMIAQAFDVDVFGEDYATGERWNSYNQIAYQVIEQEFLNQYGDIL